MKMLTVKEAVERINKGGDLEGVVLDESTTKQVSVRDAMVLSRGGIVIPEQQLYYDDSEIEYDEEIDELKIISGVGNLSWEEKAEKAKSYEEHKKQASAVLLNLSTQRPEINDWMLKNKKTIEMLLRPIVVNLFDAEKIIKGLED